MTAQPSATPSPEPTLDEIVAEAMKDPAYAAWIADIEARLDAAPPTDVEAIFAKVAAAMELIPVSERAAWAREGDIDEVLAREAASTHE